LSSKDNLRAYPNSIFFDGQTNAQRKSAKSNWRRKMTMFRVVDDKIWRRVFIIVDTWEGGEKSRSKITVWAEVVLAENLAAILAKYHREEEGYHAARDP
jgi:hypothetical protein